MRICLIFCGRLAAALRSLGHEALQLTPPPGPVLHVSTELKKVNFTPDLVVEEENLSHRLVTTGLDELDCPVVYWSKDTHLNFFWQRRLAPLYDLVLTTQPSWVESFRRADAPKADVLTWSAGPSPWIPWSKRANNAVFVGRITDQRPVRRAMLRLLEDQGLSVFSDIPVSQVPDIYRNACVVPNETIRFEVNMRLFEAASAGCAVFSPAQAVDQEEMFRPYREFFPYGDGLELLEAMKWRKAHPDQAEAMGRRAWVRTQAEHLPSHRASRLLDLAANLSGGRLKAEPARRLRALVLFEMWQGNRIDLDENALTGRLQAWPDDPACVRALLVAWLRLGRPEALDAARRISASDVLIQDPECAVAASAAAFFTEEMDLAAFALTRYARLAESRRLAPPKTPGELWTDWAALLRRAGLVHRPGFAFDPEKHPPGSAMECLYLAHRLAPEDLSIARRLDETLRHIPGADYIRTGVLSHLSLHRPGDWRLSQDLALAELRMNRVTEGLRELERGRLLSEKKEQTGPFEKRLAQLRNYRPQTKH